ncbi:MAG: VPDSG-CTERM sorting domain-containing protein [Verrucomicrobiota bacterium]
MKIFRPFLLASAVLLVGASATMARSPQPSVRQPVAVPDPGASVALFGLALAGLAGLRWLGIKKG